MPLIYHGFLIRPYIRWRLPGYPHLRRAMYIALSYRIDVSNGNKYIATYDATSYIKMEEAYASDIPRLFNPTIHTLAAAWVPSLT